MVIIIGLLLLIISFAFHVNFLFQYITKRESRYLRNYINTSVSNVVIAAGLIIIALYRPEYIQKIDLQVLFWLLSGLIMVFMLLVKISVFRRIHRRTKNPEHFHYNFFGKKVLHSSVVKPLEIALFFGSMPFFLFAGAYFVARLINLFMYSHL